MTENESKYGKIAIVGGGRCSGKTAVIQLEIFEELQAYRAIGTIEEFKDLKKKNVAKKPKEKLVDVEIYNSGGFTKKEALKICPVCRAGLSHETFCYKCGQKLDWQ